MTPRIMEIRIVSGDGEHEYTRPYHGAQTGSALRRSIQRDRHKGERWAHAERYLRSRLECQRLI